MDDNKEILSAAEEAAEEVNTKVGESADEANEAAEKTVDAAETTAEAVDNAVETTVEAVDADNQAGVTEETLNNFSDSYSSNEISDELKEVQDNAESMPAPKKKKKLMAPIIVSICIVVVAAVVALVLTVFFGKNIEGSWYYEQEVQTSYAESTSDEPPAMKIGYWFIFEGNNKLTVKSGSASGSGSFTFRTGSVEGEPIGEPVVDLNFIDPLSNQPINSTFKADISGNIFTGQKLTLTSIQNAELKIELEKKNHEAPEIKRNGDFVADKQTEGKWVNSQSGYGVTYVSVYDIKSDGTITISDTQKISSQFSGTGKDLEYTVTIEGLYTCNKGKLEIYYDRGGTQKAEIPYQIKEKGNVLTITGAQEINFYKVGSASADEILNPTTQPSTEAATEAAAQSTTK